MKLAVAATLDKVSTLKDRSIKLTFETQELDAQKCADLFSMRQQIGWLIFASEDVSEVEIPDEPPQEFKDDKSPSQRLRNTLYVWWKQSKPNMDFDSFYKLKMEWFINFVKDKLEGEPE